MTSFLLVAWMAAVLLAYRSGAVEPEPGPDSTGGNTDTSQDPAGTGANSDPAQSDTNLDGADDAVLEDLEPGDCVAATFLQAGISQGMIPRYVEVFRNNEVDMDTLLPLSVDELVGLLSGSSFSFTSGSDIFYLHKCLNDAGACAAEPFCRNGGSCVHVDMQSHHVCRCAAGFTGDQCQAVVTNSEGNLLNELRRFQRRVASTGPVYTRWGKDKCNESTSATIIYNGWMAGSTYSAGGSVTPLCLPNVPQFGAHKAGQQIVRSKVFSAEFETHDFIYPYHGIAENNPTCSVCQAKGKRSTFMFPASLSCPLGWTLEYHGYIFAERSHPGHHRSTYLCVDSSPDVVPNTGGNDNGYLLYPTEVTCAQEMDCGAGRYDQQKELPCAVCSR